MNSTQTKDPLKIRYYSIYSVIVWTVLLALFLFLNIRTIENQYFITALLWLLGLIGISITYFNLIKNDKKRLFAEESVQEFSKALEGDIEHFMHIMTDVSDRKEIEKEIEKLKNR